MEGARSLPLPCFLPHIVRLEINHPGQEARRWASRAQNVRRHPLLGVHSPDRNECLTQFCFLGISLTSPWPWPCVLDPVDQKPLLTSQSRASFSINIALIGGQRWRSGGGPRGEETEGLPRWACLTWSPATFSAGAEALLSPNTLPTPKSIL